MTRLQSHMVTSLPSSKAITPTVSCQDVLRSLLLLVVGWEDTVERFPSVVQSNVLKPQVGVVQMLNFQSTRTNHDCDSLPKKRGGGLASAMAWLDVGREVFWSPVQRNYLKIT